MPDQRVEHPELTGSQIDWHLGREASQISVSPLVNCLNPPPVPDTPTGTVTLGQTSRKLESAWIVIGATVLEPSTTIFPCKSRIPCVTLVGINQIGGTKQAKHGHPNQMFHIFSVYPRYDV
jgi:hypothetical protein